jgi:hypothetical protein
MTGPAALVLADALRHNSTLHAIDIGGNSLSEADTQSFLALLSMSRVSALHT